MAKDPGMLRTLLRILVISALLPLFILIAIVFVLPHFILLDLPVMRAMRKDKLRWRTYSEVKRLSRKGSGTASVLQTHSCLENGFIACRLRGPRELERISQLTKLRIPTAAYPLLPDLVIFYQFRYRHETGRRQRGRWHSIMEKSGLISAAPH